MLHHSKRYYQNQSNPDLLTILADKFDGINETNIHNRIPLARLNSNKWSAFQGIFVINNNQAEARFTNNSPSIITFDTGKSDFTASVNFILPSTGNNRSASILFRKNSTNSYLFAFANMDTNGGVFRIMDNTNGVNTVLAEIPCKLLANIKYKMSLVVKGDISIATIDGIGSISAITPIRNTSTIHGLRGANQVGFDVVKFDDFKILPLTNSDLLKADNYIAVSAVPLLTSDYETALTHTDAKHLLYANPTAKVKGMASLTPAIKYHNSTMHSFGQLDPWMWDGTGTKPVEPTNWGSLDSNLQMILDMKGQIILSTYNFPWWMKGKLNADGTTTLNTSTESFSDKGRILTSKVPDYLKLVQRLAERYLVAPYNVRVWQTGIEWHDWYRSHSSLNSYDIWAYDDYPGTPGDNADMGVAYQHNITVTKILEVAAALKIDPATLTFINNYPALPSEGVNDNDSVPVGHPLRDKEWGTANKQGINGITKMIPLLNRVDAWAVDMATPTQDHVVTTDDFTFTKKITDVFEYLKTQIVKPKRFVCSEIYDKPAVDPGPNNSQYRAAIHAEAHRRFLVAGGWLLIVWSTLGDAMSAVRATQIEGGLLTDTSLVTGGQPTPYLEVLKMFHDYFSKGTVIYNITVTGTGLSALASDKKVMLINQTNNNKDVNVANKIYTITPYQVRIVDR